MTPNDRSRRDVEEEAINAFIAAGRLKKLSPVADPIARAAELWRDRAAKGENSTFRKPRGRPRKSR